MKKIYTLLMLMLFCMTAGAQGSLPVFSTEDNPVWYKVQFYTGSNYVTDQGAGSSILTAASSTADTQKWQFIGKQDSCIMKSKAGRYVYYTGSRFKGNKTNKTVLKIIESPNYDGYFEIQRQTSDKSMNQWGGTSAGVQLGEWEAGNANNPLSFIAQSIADPVFSTDENPTWYFIQFCNSSLVIQDNGVGEPVRTMGADPVDAQLWKLVGTKDNFQIVNKLGHYLEVSNTAATSESPSNSKPVRTSESEFSAGFKLTETTNATYQPAWEITPNNSTSNGFNQWGGTGEGKSIGIWTTGDSNNPLKFVLSTDMKYNDYRVSGIESYSPENKLTLWYDQPATTSSSSNKWMEYSLPIGNGQFGASLFGGVQTDEIQFNEKTLWSGTRTDNGSSYGSYQNFGSVYAEDLSGVFDYSSDAAPQDYYRQLDLTTATGKVSFKSPDKSVTFTREYIASNPAQVVAARYTADKAGQISLRFTLKPGRPGLTATTSYADGEATFAGKLSTVSYNARLKVVATGGDVTTGTDGITVKGADEVVVYLAGTTDFDATAKTYISNTSAIASTVQARVNDAAAKTWSELYDAHVADFKSYFDRVEFDIDGSSNTVSTKDLVDTYSQGSGANAAMLEQLYFAYGRYLEISSSRGVDLPSNLQGIWNNVSSAPWNADIHSNINVQMNYWPAEPTNLSEMHLPFLNYIINMATNHTEWAGYAKAAGQTRGWTCYTENNIFGGVGSFMHNYVIANAWYCTHLWQHYRYTLDRDFLKRAFPAMLSATQFWLDRMVIDSNDNTYICPNEYSPEHGPGSATTMHAQQIVADLLDNTKAAIDVLGDEAGVSDSDMELLNSRLAALDRGLATETYDGSWGNPHNGVKTGDVLLREWKDYAYSQGSDGHRHMSHLMCVYPFSQITPSSPYYEAAVNSMKLRGDESTGWSMGWKINLWARLQNGERAYTILSKALRHSTAYSTNQYAGGIYYNLYDSHAPFQIDGNFGACSGISEMLMQSNSDTILILPALPTAWASGHITGLKAVGDFTVSTTWKEGKASNVTIVNNQGGTAVVKYAGIGSVATYVDGVKQEATEGSDDVVTISGKAGSVVVFDFAGTYDPATGISNAATDGTLAATVNGRTVTLTGADVKNVKVYDLAGRLTAKGTKAAITVPAATGNTAIVKAETKDGKKQTFKLTIQ